MRNCRGRRTPATFRRQCARQVGECRILTPKARGAESPSARGGHPFSALMPCTADRADRPPTTGDDDIDAALSAAWSIGISLAIGESPTADRTSLARAVRRLSARLARAIPNERNRS
jgi:hypothetical protein